VFVRFRDHPTAIRSMSLLEQSSPHKTLVRVTNVTADDRIKIKNGLSVGKRPGRSSVGGTSQLQNEWGKEDTMASNYQRASNTNHARFNRHRDAGGHGRSREIVCRENLRRQSGERTNPAGKPVSNRILLSIPESEYRVIRPYLEYLTLPSHLTLHEPGERLKFLYFPNAGLISLVVLMKDGRTVEVGVMGSEGAAGVPIAAGLTRNTVREIVQITTDGFKVEAGAMLNILKSTPQLQMILTRYAIVFGMQVAQTVACNRLHRIEQRLARWLLMAEDRAETPMIAMTHDFLATMLGTNRPTVSSAAAILHKKKGIDYVRGGVKIVNRKKLEASACECYGVMQGIHREVGLGEYASPQVSGT
jgi:CRP-like cAMP-binding protein